MDNLTEAIGIAAALSASCIYLPQVIKTVRSKDTKSISLIMYIVVAIGNLLWLTYGLLSQDIAIVLSQVFLLPMGLIILVYKIIYK